MAQRCERGGVREIADAADERSKGGVQRGEWVAWRIRRGLVAVWVVEEAGGDGGEFEAVGRWEQVAD